MAACLEFATRQRFFSGLAKRARVLREGYAQSIIGATEKRRESGAVCRGIGGSESTRRMSSSLSGKHLGCPRALFHAFTTLNVDAAVYGIRRGFAGDHRVSDTESDMTNWVLPILGCF